MSLSTSHPSCSEHLVSEPAPSKLTHSSSRKKALVTVLGSTGSIGQSTLDVVSANPDHYEIFALSAHTQTETLANQCMSFSPKFAVIQDETRAKELRARLSHVGCQTEVLTGRESLLEIASEACVDIVMAAIVGAAGLEPTMAAVTSGKRVLLANKESLVMSGGLFIDSVASCNAKLLPVDSEHNAIFQCLPSNFKSLESSGVSKILLTGSGGPFRTRPLNEFTSISPEEACAHPNWSMGAKISVDSATMMNKGLEFIEACWLFNARPENIDVVIHPQSIVHSMVQYYDGSVLAQMGEPDMRTPIAHTMAWPERIDSKVKALDFTLMSNLSFEPVDHARFPCLSLAIEAIKAGGDRPAALNAANEIAVEAFLNHQIKFTEIARINDELMQSWNQNEPQSIDDVIHADQTARALAQAMLKSC